MAESRLKNQPWADLSRQQRKKMATRESLFVAFQELLMENELDSITVNDITEKADVGLGTFYNYFKSKNEIIEGLFELAMDFYHKELDEITKNLEDPAEILAASIVYTVQKLTDASQFGWLIFEVGLSSDVLRDSIYSRAVEDFQRGVATERFKADDIPLIIIMLEGSVMAVAEAIYRKTLPKKSIQKVAELGLRQLGLTPKEANVIAFKKYSKTKSVCFPLRLSEL